ncbi:MAG: adenylate kinase [Candidatus Omnitrophica bacterium]|nr:adenylate kinase [Candidatus Omnitrophota bacterium]
MRLVLLGPPGAGKGSVAALLKKNFSVVHISTGDLLRDEIKEGSPLGKEAKSYIDNGNLVPDEVVIKLIENKIKTDDQIKNGYLFDGFPRTKNQAKGLDEILEKIGKPIEAVFYMETAADLILMRLTGRRICRDCGAVYHIHRHPPKKEGVCDQCSGTDLYQRSDDKEETIKNRLDVYLENTLPIVDYYEAKGILNKIDGGLESEELEAIIAKTCHAS